MPKANAKPSSPPAGIEQIAHYEEQVRVAIIGDLDHVDERLANLVAQLYAGIGRAEGVGFEMNVQGMENLSGFRGLAGNPILTRRVARRLSSAFARGSL